MDNTFTYKTYEHDGKIYDLLTANEYPWMNLQVIPTPEDEHDEKVALLRAQPNIGWVIEHPGRRDFAVIHIGGSSHPVEVNQENWRQVADDMQQCMRNAAKWWAENHPKP